MALRVANAQPASRDQDRAAGSTKPYFYDTGRILGRISRLYGYALVISGCSSVFASAVSSLPLTDWGDDGGVPRANLGVVTMLIDLWSGVAVSDEGEARGSDLA